MPKLLPRVTTRQRAFLEEHSFPLDIVVGDVPLQREGVSTIDMVKDHPWFIAGGTLSYGGGSGLFTYGYPDEQIAAAADAAREGDWAELIGPEGVRQLAEVRVALLD